MDRRIVVIVAAVCVATLASCATRTDLTREERVERLRNDSRLADEQQLERTRTARTQLQYEGRQAASTPKP